MNGQLNQIVTTVNGVTFPNPGAFWFGVVATSVGVILHLPMYIGARNMGYHLAGMPMDTSMLIGMFLVIVGLIASFYGLSISPSNRRLGLEDPGASPG